MERARGRNAVSDDVIDGAPLLGSVAGETARDLRIRQGMRRPSIRGATRFLHRASSRRVMREPSMLVREAAAEQLEERQSDWAYSRPVVFLDVIWNLAFVIVAAAVLMLSRDESPAMPMRIWIVGYAVQCVLHMVCVCSEYDRRKRAMQQGEGERGHRSSEDVEYAAFLDQPEETARYAMAVSCNFHDILHFTAKHLESAITMFSFVWWITGFYWVSAGGQNLIQDAPQLYWLCVVFLAFDVFFVVFCVALACVIGIAVCCCLPCIIAILYAVADQEGASEEDVRRLPKYMFQSAEAVDKLNLEKSGPFGGTMMLCDGGSHAMRVISPEDAECCICLSVYDDGSELRALPCGHHFHCVCIDKWLYINATCPLCKYNIVKNGIGSIEEV